MTPQDTVSHRKLVNKQVRRGETSKIPSKCENSIPGQILNYLAPGSTKIFYLTLFGGVLFLLWKCQTSTCARRILANHETSCHPRFRACSKALRIGPEKRWFFNIVLVNAHNIQKKKKTFLIERLRCMVQNGFILLPCYFVYTYIKRVKYIVLSSINWSIGCSEGLVKINGRDFFALLLCWTIGSKFRLHT